MNDGPARFAARFPRVWHVIEADGAGDWLAKTGLFPAAELHSSDDNRDDFIRVALGQGRVAVLRPQLMQDRHLGPTLRGEFVGRPMRWRRHVNSHVFFWTEPLRRDAFLRACVRLRSGTRPPVILTLDTARLLGRHGAIAFFATINTGSTLRGGARAGRDEETLQPVAVYRSGPVAELAIRGCVQIADAAILDPS